jgi:3-phosphoshikimate 1-carboxyvinyltransferase
MASRILHPARALRGTLRLPGDKSISHRYAMLAAIAEGTSEISNYSTGADCASTLGCMQALGAGVTRDGSVVAMEGRGLNGLRAAAAQLDAGNSGSTIRMLSGILAGQPFTSTIGGDESLSRRPMGRIIMPLNRMGASIKAREGGLPPLEIHGAALKPIDYELPVASAQVKTAVLFAGLYADGVSSVTQPMATRDHSERALREFGARVEIDGLTVRVHGRPQLRGRNLRVPADLSSAAFFLAAALLLPESELVIEGVGLNPTRAELLDVLRQMGADIEVLHCQEIAGEAVGDLRVRSSANKGPTLKGGVIEGAATAGVIDEVPILAVLGALSREGLEVRDAAELRVKETDRIATLADNLARLGVHAETFGDGIKIPGQQTFQAAELDSFGDHRIAMAFAVAALRASGPCSMTGAEAASVSFPEFYTLLDQVAVRE